MSAFIIISGSAIRCAVGALIGRILSACAGLTRGLIDC